MVVQSWCGGLPIASRCWLQNETLAGLPVESPDPAAVVSALERLTTESEYTRFAEGALRAGETFIFTAPHPRGF